MKNHSAGFTIVEILLYMGLLAIFIVILTQTFLSSLDILGQAEATSSVEQDGRFILSRLTYDITESSAITAPGSLGISSNTLTLRETGGSYTFSLSGTDLQLSGPLGTARLNSSETQVSGLSFTLLGGSLTKPTVQISFTVTSKTLTNGKAQTINYQTTVGMR